MNKLIARFKAWRKARYWQERQIEHLTQLLLSDSRWLAHDPTATALTERYLRALRSDWYSWVFVDSNTLRQRLGLDPHRAPSTRADNQTQTKE